MLPITSSQIRRAASAKRLGMTVRAAGISALVSFYFGYWFSHWRA